MKLILIQNYIKELNYLNNKKYASNDRYVGIYLDVNEVFEPTYGGPEVVEYSDDSLRRKHLEKQIKQPESSGIEEDNITKITSDILENDWNISLERDKTKCINWVKIFKKSSNEY